MIGTRFATLAIVLLLAPSVQGQGTSTASAPKPAVIARPAVAPLSAPQHAQLQSAVTQHAQVRAQLSPSDRADLDKFTAHVRKDLFAAPPGGNLMTRATQIVSRSVPSLTAPEASTLAAYALDGIATAPPAGAAVSSGQDQLLNATKQMQETQMSFNLQYLQLQSQMQSENRSYAAISKIMQTKHDAVKNSISNIR